MSEQHLLYGPVSISDVTMESPSPSLVACTTETWKTKLYDKYLLLAVKLQMRITLRKMKQAEIWPSRDRQGCAHTQNTIITIFSKCEKGYLSAFINL